MKQPLVTREIWSAHASPSSIPSTKNVRLNFSTFSESKVAKKDVRLNFSSFSDSKVAKY